MSGIVGNNTGIESGQVIATAGAGYITDTSDPTTSTNPSAVGIVFTNSDTGETYVCNTATAGSNVWKNVGGGTGDIEPTVTSQGTQYGFLGGGYLPSAATGLNIQKFSLTADTDSVDHGADLSISKSHAGGHQSWSMGYSSSGAHPTSGAIYDVIDKFPFASSTNAVDWGDLTQARSRYGDASSLTHGYGMGGTGSPSYTGTDVIDKFSFTSDAGASDVGDTQSPSYDHYGQCGMSHINGGYAYCAGGNTYVGSNQWDNTIQKVAYDSDANAIDVADLTLARDSSTASSSTTYGYISGGISPGSTDRHEKYQFATTNNACDIGNLISGVIAYGTGISGIGYGYYCGGYHSVKFDMIQKYSYTSDGDSVDGGANLVSAMYSFAGIHH